VKKLKILGIDDNEDLLNLCETVLTSDGHEYTGISDGKNGLQAIRDEKFDVVLLDLSMPDFSGMDVIDALVKDGIMNKQKVVIFTAMSPAKKEIDLFLEKRSTFGLKETFRSKYPIRICSQTRIRKMNVVMVHQIRTCKASTLLYHSLIWQTCVYRYTRKDLTKSLNYRFRNSILMKKTRP